VLAALNYGARLGDTTPAPPDVLFRWSTSIGTLAIDGVLLAILVLAARGHPLGETFALRPPVSWSAALRIAGAALAATWATSFVLEATVGHAAREQAIPAFWDPSRAPQFAASALAIGVFVPIVEEAMCRGLGYTLLLRWGQPVAIVGTSFAFALAHGAILDFPWVLVTGLGLGYLRACTASLYPCIGLHAFINTIAVLVSALIAPTPGPTAPPVG
jgi:membrane protease YdiL (CAAX protease family)